MIYRLHTRRRRAVRHNPKRHSRRRISAWGKHRPVVIHSPHGWFRAKHSKMFPRPTRLNPRRRRKHARRHYRHNPVAVANPRRMRRYSFRRHARRNPNLPFGIDKVAMGGLKVAGGLVAGAMLMPIYVKFLPKDVTASYGKYYGALNVILGAIGAAMIRKPLVKDIALTVAATGVYDLIASNVTMLGLPPLPRVTPLLMSKEEKTAWDAAHAAVHGYGAEPGVIGMGSSYQQVGADFAPALGSNYEYAGADDISYGGDEIEIG